MKKILSVFLIVVAFATTSCNVKVSDRTNPNEFKDGVTYFQDDVGSVFAVIIIRKQMSMQQEGIGLAYIPKAEVTPEIKEMIKNYKE